MNGLRGNSRMRDKALRDGLCERCGAADQPGVPLAGDSGSTRGILPARHVAAELV
jgi:hypothetical protein